MAKTVHPSALATGCLGLLLATTVSSHDLGKANESYVGDSGGHLLTDGFGDCVQTGSWNKGTDLVDCGAAAAREPVAEPQPVAAAAPVPAPVTPIAVSAAVSLSAGALFDVNSANLKQEGKAELDALARQVGDMEEVRSINIVGHTDSSGSEAYNQALSKRRAIAVKDYLVGRGISPQVLSTEGMGESSPVASNATREGRARNRRVELTIEGTRAP